MVQKVAILLQVANLGRLHIGFQAYKIQGLFLPLHALQLTWHHIQSLLLFRWMMKYQLLQLLFIIPRLIEEKLAGRILTLIRGPEVWFLFHSAILVLRP